MPLAMMRPGTFVLAVIALGGVLPAARAEEPPCPSQIAPPGAAPEASAAAAAEAVKPAAPSGTV